MIKIVQVEFEYGIPKFDGDQLVDGDCNWLYSSINVAIKASCDNQYAVDIARAEEMNRVDTSCSKDAPINTVRGFRLLSVKTLATSEIDNVQ